MGRRARILSTSLTGCSSCSEQPIQTEKGEPEMGKIVVSENVSLDGVVQDPAGDEGFSRGGWVGLIAAREDVAKVALDEAVGAEAFLLGRRSKPLVAPPAKQESLGADRLVERDLGHIFAGSDQTDPASAAEALVTRRVLNDPVERHVLADDDLSHLGFPFLRLNWLLRATRTAGETCREY